MIFKFLKTSYTNVKNALAKTGSLLGSKLRSLFSGKIDEDTLDKLEQLLYEADLGVEYAQELTNKIRNRLRESPKSTNEELLEEIRKDLISTLKPYSSEIHSPPQNTPLIILIVGVNGNGKTTSIAKLAQRFHHEGKKVLLGAADTFRAAAIDQLEMWAKRVNADIVKGTPNSDPAAVVFDAITAGKARGADVILIDTAGRLHTKKELMAELEKMRRVCKKAQHDAPHETLLVLDATTGQNAIDQAKTFHQFTPLTGLILTKLDGTAKGGIVLAIQRKVGIPVKFIGVGEGAEDLQPFDTEAFINTLLE